MSVPPSILLDHRGLPPAAQAVAGGLDRAATEELSYADCREGVVAEEVVARRHAATERRLPAAGVPYAASIEQFDFRFRPELKRQVILRYRAPTFVSQAGTLTVVGAPGLGKTMLVIGGATKQVPLGATARFITAQALAGPLGRAATARGRPRLLKPLLTCAGRVLDELGYLPTTETSFGPALVEVIAGRYEKRPTILTSNKSLTDWSLIVQDVSLAAAIVDRIVHHGQVIETSRQLTAIHQGCR